MTDNIDPLERKLFLGFVRIHILHHAEREEVYGTWLMDELSRHGYSMSPGTLYPILHSLEEGGYLSSEKVNVDGKVRRYYKTTTQGKRVLQRSRDKVAELFHEVMD